MHTKPRRETATGVLLFAVRSGDDLDLSWSGGVAPYFIERSETGPIGFEEVAACEAGPTWRDPLVVNDGRLLFYRVRP